jgi:transcriptional regulator PpsR
VPVKQFEAPQESLGDLRAEVAAQVIAAAADVTLVVDAAGVIRDYAFGVDQAAVDGAERWRGRPWVDTVTVESRPKIEQLLRDAAAGAPPRGRQVNHPSGRGADTPVLYSAVEAGRAGGVVALGRDLRSIAALQQRLVDAQQSMERDFWRLRNVETRYRLLFQMASEAVLIVDAAAQKVVEANRASGELLGGGPEGPAGRPFPEGFDAESTQAIETLLAGVRAAGRADECRARLAADGREFLVSASLFRQESATLLLVRLTPVKPDVHLAVVPRAQAAVLKVVERAPDAFVVTDPDGRILTANPAFLDLAQLASGEQARGESLERWLGRPGVDLSVLLANLRQHGSVRLFPTTLRGEHGLAAEVEICAVSVVDAGTPCCGFAIRNVGQRVAAEPRTGRDLPQAVEHLTELVGRVALKDLVREATDLIERMCIEAALELTGDNRASAAEMLGLSRQSLYVKLHRYGLGELATDK